ncbi:fruit protein pKIWI502 [Ananas comosus]|uniref:Fruit protein pKIWI502 n=1 Tax=Ananas comosus TaxID=4615 RepID=A0A6P5FWX8_ANACO|nr:fruit protein pKIWI502 [Ananas comosus]
MAATTLHLLSPPTLSLSSSSSSSSSLLLPFPHMPRPLPLRRLRRHLSAVASAVRHHDAAASLWTPAPLALVAPASADASLFHVALDLSDAPDLAAAHTAPGQYLQLRLPSAASAAAEAKPTFLAIASPPPMIPSSAGTLRFEFLVKRVPGSTAELLCGLRDGDVVEVSAVMGRGFAIERISPPHAFPTVLIFATGSGISPIRSLIESGFNANKRADVRLYYGARNLDRMAYQDKFKDWESTGVRILPVLSRPDNRWKGKQGYVQNAFSRAEKIVDPSSTGAVLCGHKQMTEEITSVLVADGVPKDRILKNF